MGKYLMFHLSGDLAMWRNPYEPMGSFSCLGPAPSNIAGILGAAIGMASPVSYAAEIQVEEKEEKTANIKKAAKKQNKNKLLWPVSPELLEWEKNNDFNVACGWIGHPLPSRISWNVNGLKNIHWKPKSQEDKALSSITLRLQQQVIEKPAYKVIVKLDNEEAIEELGCALKSPCFPLYLGASFCRAIVNNIKIMNEAEANEEIKENQSIWAYRKDFIVPGELTPFSLHVVNDKEANERIISEGYWVYPTKHIPREKIQESPFVQGYKVLEKKNGE